MHNTAFQLLGLDCHYEALDIEPASLKQAVERFREQSWGGVNVTVPHKEAIISLIDEVVPEAQGVGAVNTVMNRDDRLVGYNTDILGIERSLQPDRANIEGQQCTILGSGGVARAVTHVLIHNFRAASITFAALYPEQAHALVQRIGRCKTELHVVPYTEAAVETAVKNSTLIVNATTVGMFPHNQESPLANQRWLSSHHIVFDLVYRPLKTRLLSEAQGVGARTIDGLDMFIQQGAAAFQLWTGKNMPLEQIRQTLENKLNADNN